MSHELTDVNVGGVVGFAAALIGTGIVIGALVWFLFLHFRREAARPMPVEFPLATAALRRLPPEPRLQTNPRDDLAHLRDSEDRLLTSYGWIDRNAGIVRIPIDQAMTLIAERGLPTRPAREAGR
jgi:hypothetical protein